MLTRCEQCGTWFRIRAEQLEVAQGRVRCGRCGNLFNARATLIQDPTPGEEGRSLTEGTDRHDRPGPPAPPTPPTQQAPDPTDRAMHTDPRVPEPSLQPPPDEDWSQALATAPDAERPEDFAPSEATLEPESETQHTPFTNAIPESQPDRAPHNFASAPRRRLHWLWTLGSLLTALVIVVEIAAITRHQGTQRLMRAFTATPLVTAQSGHAPVRPTLIRVLSAEVRRMRRGPNGLKIEGTLLNASANPTGMPDLLIRFTNLNGDIVAEGLFGPRSYLEPPEPHAVMPAHAGVAFRLRVVDPGRRAVGFSIRTCRKMSHHRIFCSTAG